MHAALQLEGCRDLFDQIEEDNFHINGASRGREGDAGNFSSAVRRSLRQLVDVFEGQNIPEGKKSMAINVVMQATDKTLTEKDLDQVSEKIINTVKEKTGATIRS